jgi:hypothetical protein
MKNPTRRLPAVGLFAARCCRHPTMGSVARHLPAAVGLSRRAWRFRRSQIYAPGFHGLRLLAPGGEAPLPWVVT